MISGLQWRLTKSDDQFYLRIHFRDCNVDFLDCNLHAGIQLHQVRNFSIQVEVCAQFLDGQFDATNMQLRDVEVDIWCCAGGCCTRARGRRAGSAACAVARESARGSQSSRRRSSCLSRNREDGNGEKEEQSGYRVGSHDCGDWEQQYSKLRQETQNKPSKRREV
jgi:hypothetical protein